VSVVFSCFFAIFAALFAAIPAFFAVSAISPSTRPGTLTETTFTANAPTVRICHPRNPNAGIETSHPDAVSFAKPTTRPPAAATIAPTAASRASTMTRRATLVTCVPECYDFIGGAEKNIVVVFGRCQLLSCKPRRAR